MFNSTIWFNITWYYYRTWGWELIQHEQEIKKETGL